MSNQAVQHTELKKFHHEMIIQNDYVIRNALPEDDKQLTALIGRNVNVKGTVLAFERKPSYLKATYALYEIPEPMVIEKKESGELIGMFNMGIRQTYINGVLKPLRYLAEFRCVNEKDMELALNLIRVYLTNHLVNDEIYQSIILDETIFLDLFINSNNATSLEYYKTDGALTYTLTGFKNSLPENSNLVVDQMQLIDISEVHRFIKHMADYYNFLPAYDFNQLVAQTPYWQGITLEDFFIVRRNANIVGLFGLWNQQSFKQITVIHYDKMLSIVRPLYNYWAGLTKMLHLPQPGEKINHLMLHSILSNPYNIEIFDFMLRVALDKANARQHKAISFSLVKNDPRNDCSLNFVARKLKITYGFHSKNPQNLQKFDQNRITYIECGRT